MNKPYWEKLRRFREEAGLSQPELYRLSGVSIGTIRALEQPYEKQRAGVPSRTRYPSIETLERLAEALEVSPAEFAEYRLARARELLDERARGLDEALRCLEAFDSAQQRLAEELSASEAQRTAATDRPDSATGHGSLGPAGVEPAS